jgi:hypothetical protein
MMLRMTASEGGFSAMAMAMAMPSINGQTDELPQRKASRMIKDLATNELRCDSGSGTVPVVGKFIVKKQTSTRVLSPVDNNLGARGKKEMDLLIGSFTCFLLCCVCSPLDAAFIRTPHSRQNVQSPKEM